MLLVEYAKFGNLRDYLRRKRPAGHVLSGSFESPTDEPEALLHDENDDVDRSLTMKDLLEFSLQIACGMEYLHGKKVKNKKLRSFISEFQCFRY